MKLEAAVVAVLLAVVPSWPLPCEAPGPCQPVEPCDDPGCDGSNDPRALHPCQERACGAPARVGCEGPGCDAPPDPRPPGEPGDPGQ